MKVSELIEHLKQLDQESDIYFDNSGDEYGLGELGAITFSFSDLENSPKGEYILRTYVPESGFLRSRYWPEYKEVNEITIKRIED